MKEIRIFLASSNELERERELFEINLYRKCQEWFNQKKAFLYLDIWENMSAKMSQTNSQDEYNKFVENADIVVVLAYSKVGKYTYSEFETARRTFKSTNKPFIFIYFKSNPKYTGSNLKDLESLENFKKLLSDLVYFYPSFDNFDDLWNQFNKELDGLANNGFKEIVREISPLKQGESNVNITGNDNVIIKKNTGNVTVTKIERQINQGPHSEYNENPK